MYNHKEVEQKWAKVRDERKEYKCDTYDFSKPKYYILDMFPYPSGQGLHVGHPEGYTATDIVARMKRMQGFNVLHPIGWDAFGLPAEQYAMKMNEHPEKFTLKNDYATSIQWSAFSLSTFFIGTQNGKFIRYEIEIGHVVKFSKVWELSFGFAINYICVEPQFGRFCSIASSNGSLAIITKIDTANPEASPDVVKLNDSADKLIDIKFYPTTIHFLVLLTESYALLYSIDESTTVALINLKSMQKFHILHDSGNVAMIVFNDSVHLWKFSINQNIRLAELPLSTSKLSGQNEISCCDMMGDKLLLVTQGGWLTTVEARNNKLFSFICRNFEVYTCLRCCCLSNKIFSTWVINGP